jgi:hypothetical protein
MENDNLDSVVFKIEKNGGVLAVFPFHPGTYDPTTCSVYAHIGQHSVACWNYVTGLRNAKPGQYAGLLAELVRLGYVPKVLNRLPSRNYAQQIRRAAIN